MATWWLSALGLNLFGCLMVASAAQDPNATLGLGAEARNQLLWTALAVTLGLAASRVSWAWWRRVAPIAYGAALATIIGMILLAGTPLVPFRKGCANWIVLGSFQIQPVEFVKLATLLAVTRWVAAPGFHVTSLGHVILTLAVAALPALLLAGSQDLGSALTFPGMVLGILVILGMRGRHLGLLLATGAILISLGYQHLPREGAKSYQYRRIQAWLHPDDYAMTEGYQTARSVAAIGSGRWLGKGWRQGEQNRLGLVPEKHTDLISAVVGEEWGWLGTVGMLMGYGVFFWSGLTLVARVRERERRAFIGGTVCFLGGQASINLAVAQGLLPVTGVTLPLLSYGGSSLVGTWLMVGIAAAAAREPAPGQAR